MNGVVKVQAKVGACLTFLYTDCSAGSRSSSMWKRGGLVDDSFMGSGRAMILPSSPNHFFPLSNTKTGYVKIKLKTASFWAVWHVSWCYLLHFQNAILQNVLIGLWDRGPLPYIETLILQITRLHVFRQFNRGRNCEIYMQFQLMTKFSMCKS